MIQGKRSVVQLTPWGGAACATVGEEGGGARTTADERRQAHRAHPLSSDRPAGHLAFDFETSLAGRYHERVSRLVIASVGALLTLLTSLVPARAAPPPEAAAAPASFARARTLMSTDPAAAAAELGHATEEAPSYAPAWYALAMTERRLGKHEAAIAAYHRYLALVPSDCEPLYGLGLSLIAVGNTSEAASVLNRFVRDAREPRLAPFVEKARGVLASLPPTDDFPGLLRTGREAIARGHYETAAERLHKAVALAPQSADALYDLAFVERQLGHPAEAIRALRSYTALAPGDPDAYYALAVALAGAGDRPAAAEALRTYLRLEHRPAEARWIARARRRLEALEGRSTEAGLPGTPPSATP